MYGGNVTGELGGRRSKRNRNRKREWDDDQTPRGYLRHTEDGCPTLKKRRNRTQSYL
jgi:hypothetical protein